jgi:excinuclease UvrABC ATPase subunit
MGTITDIYSVLRRLYSHIGKPHVGHSNVFSFNDLKGMCPNCNAQSSSPRGTLTI